MSACDDKVVACGGWFLGGGVLEWGMTMGFVVAVEFDGGNWRGSSCGCRCAVSVTNSGRASRGGCGGSGVRGWEVYGCVCGGAGIAGAKVARGGVDGEVTVVGCGGQGWERGLLCSYSTGVASVEAGGTWFRWETCQYC